MTSGLPPTSDIVRPARLVRFVPIGDMVRPLENEREAANRGGLSCFYGRAVSLTLRSAIMESGEFLPESARHDWRGVYRAKSHSVSETRARMRSRSRSPPLPPPPPGFHSSS
jgi:hypothetical protein